MAKKLQKLSFALAMMVIIGIAYWHFYIYPRVLTNRYGAELETVLEHVFQTVHNYEVGEDQEIVKAVATGDYLRGLLNPQRLSCPKCPYRIVVINIQVSNLKVLSYSGSMAKVRARIETAQVSIYGSTSKIEVPCYGLAHEGIIILTKEDDNWKVSGGQSSQIDTWTPVEIMRQNVCPENWEDRLKDFLAMEQQQ